MSKRRKLAIARFDASLKNVLLRRKVLNGGVLYFLVTPQCFSFTCDMDRRLYFRALESNCNQIKRHVNGKVKLLNVKFMVPQHPDVHSNKTQLDMGDWEDDDGPAVSAPMANQATTRPVTSLTSGEVMAQLKSKQVSISEI